MTSTIEPRPQARPGLLFAKTGPHKSVRLQGQVVSLPRERGVNSAHAVVSGRGRAWRQNCAAGATTRNVPIKITPEGPHRKLHQTRTPLMKTYQFALAAVVVLGS